MLSLNHIKTFYPPLVSRNRGLQKYMIKEYILLQILDYLVTTQYLKKIVLNGGTNLRLIKGIERFSEDLDFDCKDMTKEDFFKMTDGIALFLKRNGYKVEIRDRYNEKIKAYRRNIYFPQFLFEMELSGHREERFLIKVESQDQKVTYTKKMASVKGCGFFFLFPVPTDEVLCSMKISALLSRQKGRDFYDVMFLLSQSNPDFSFLSFTNGITNKQELKSELLKLSQNVNLSHKAKDFEHLVFDRKNTNKILYFKEFVENITV